MGGGIVFFGNEKKGEPMRRAGEPLSDSKKGGSKKAALSRPQRTSISDRLAFSPAQRVLSFPSFSKTSIYCSMQTIREGKRGIETLAWGARDPAERKRRMMKSANDDLHQPSPPSRKKKNMVFNSPASSARQASTSVLRSIMITLLRGPVWERSDERGWKEA